MADEKISQMTYKQLAADDYVPAVNPSTNPIENYYFLGADIPLLVGISLWNSAATYSVGHVVIYNGTTVKGIFLVKTATSASEAPEGAGYAKFIPISLIWVNNNFDVEYSPSDIIDIGSMRTGTIIFKDTITASSVIMIILAGDFTLATTGNLVLTQVGGPGTGGESFQVERYSTTQINIYFTAVNNYAVDQFKLNFEYKGM